MRRPRVLIIGPKPGNMGGIEKCINEIMKYCSKSNKINLTIYTTSVDTTEIGLHNRHNIPVKIFRKGEYFPYFPKGLYKTMKKNAKDFDLVHIHGTGSIEPFLAVLAAKGIPIYITPHYHPIGSILFLGIIKKIYDPIFNKIVLKRAKVITCVSETEKKIIINRFGIEDKKISIIPNGVNTGIIKNSSPFDMDKKVILYIGRLERYKNIHYVIDALKYLSDDYIFYIIGTGPYKQKLIGKGKNEGVSNRIKFLGRVSDKELHRWLRTASVVVNLSSIEAFGITVIEALAAGKPVIVSDKLALKEQSEKFEAVIPIQIKKKNLKSLARCIAKVSTKNYQPPSLNRYNWDNIAEEYCRIYQRIAEGEQIID